MSKDKKPQCPFIQRFAEDLKLARKSERTVQSNCRALRKLSEHLGHDPRAGDQGSPPLVFWLLFQPGGRHIYAGERQPSVSHRNQESQIPKPGGR